MLLCDEGSGYNYGKYFENKLRAYGFDDTDVLKVKLWASWYPNEPDGDCGKVDRRREVIQKFDVLFFLSKNLHFFLTKSTVMTMINKMEVLHQETCTIKVQFWFSTKIQQNTEVSK